jgi:hypothetical protein
MNSLVPLVKETADIFKYKAFPIGTVVKSISVGIIEEFIGDVIGYVDHGYIVRNYKDNTKWVRSMFEITNVENENAIQ